MVGPVDRGGHSNVIIISNKIYNFPFDIFRGFIGRKEASKYTEDFSGDHIAPGLLLLIWHSPPSMSSGQLPDF